MKPTTEGTERGPEFEGTAGPSHIEQGQQALPDRKCPVCGQYLRQLQVETMIGNPKYSEWAREGFCSLRCFEASKSPGAADAQERTPIRPKCTNNDISQNYTPVVAKVISWIIVLYCLWQLVTLHTYYPRFTSRTSLYIISALTGSIYLGAIIALATKPRVGLNLMIAGGVISLPLGLIPIIVAILAKRKLSVADGLESSSPASSGVTLSEWTCSTCGNDAGAVWVCKGCQRRWCESCIITRPQTLMLDRKCICGRAIGGVDRLTRTQ